MFPCLAFGYGYWWLFPVIMLAMMVLCFFIMRRHKGSVMCSMDSGSPDGHSEKSCACPLDILNKKNAQRKINKQGYGEKKEDIALRT